MTNLLKKIVKKKITEKIPVYIPMIEGSFLNNKVVLITGGSSGIGYSIAEASLRNGATVIITGRDPKKLETAKEKLSKISKNVYSYIMDISNVEKNQDNIKKIFEDFENKKINVLVNCAGINTQEKFGNTSEYEYDKVLDTNLKGTYFLSQQLANYMIENKIKGNILNVCSSSSIRPANTPYSVSKWGMHGLTLGMAKQLIKHDIVVNGIAPGATATPMLSKSNDSDISHNHQPLKRFIMPEEIANISVMLMSDIGKCIVGDIIYATGGAGTITYDDISY